MIISSFKYFEATCHGVRGFVVPHGLEIGAAAILGGAGLVSGIGGMIASKRNVDATNATQVALQNQNNQLAIDLQQQQNDFNLDMWNRNNEYNSLSSQMERAKEAGVNPNSVLGNSAVSSPVQQSTLPYPQSPQLENSGSLLSNGANQLASLFVDAPLKIAQTEKTKKESGLIWSQKQYNDILSQYYPKLKDKEIDVMSKQMFAIDNQCQEIQQKMKESVARISLMSEQEKEVAIRNIWTDKIFEHQVKGMLLDNKEKEIALPYVKARILAELGLANAQTKNYLANARLSDATIGQVNAMVGLIGAQTSAQRFSNIMNARYEPLERKSGLGLTEQNTEKLRFDNTWYGRGLNYFSGALGQIGSMYVGAKTLGKSPRVRNKVETKARVGWDGEGHKSTTRDWFE